VIVKKTTLTCTLTLLALALTSCMQAQRDRSAAYKTSSSNSANSNSPTYNYSGGTTSTPTPTATASATATAVASDAAHCSWSTNGISGYSGNHHHIGQYNVCQSSTSKEVVYVQISDPIEDAQVCLIPTTSSGSRSVYIGEARCQMLTDSSKVYKFQLYKNRTGFSGYTTTGVMLLKDKAYFYPPPFYQYVLSPDAYIFCNQFLASYGDSSYCESFKSVDEYVYVQF